MKYFKKGKNLFLYILKNTFRYSGRACRLEMIAFFVVYLLFCIISVLIIFLSALYTLMPSIVSRSAEEPSMFFIWMFSYIYILISFIVFFVPGVSLAVRRMHDMNMSGWFILLFIILKFIPVINIFGIIIEIYFYFIKPGDEENNRYGAPSLICNKI